MGVEAKEDHLQSRPNISIKAWQDQEEAIKDLPATNKQNRSLLHDHQTTEQTKRPTVCQPTLHSIENTTYCMDGRGNLKDGISIHGPRIQGPRTILIVLTESINSAARSGPLLDSFVIQLILRINRLFCFLF